MQNLTKMLHFVVTMATMSEGIPKAFKQKYDSILLKCLWNKINHYCFPSGAFRSRTRVHVLLNLFILGHFLFFKSVKVVCLSVRRLLRRDV